MAIIDLTPISPAAAKVNQFRLQINRSFSDMSRLGKEIHDYIWTNKELSPQQVLDTFGKDAVDLLKVGDAFNALSKVYFGVEPLLPPQGKTLIRNSDGTVTIQG